MGRRKIEMKMVKDVNSRQVTFSKRRNGVFTKANELAILCGVTIAVVCFSPGGKPYSIGNPSVEAVIDRFEKGNSKKFNDEGSSSKRPRSDKIKKLTEEFEDVFKKLEIAKKRGEMLDKSLKEMAKDNPLIRPLNDLNKSDLLKLNGKLRDLRDKVKDQVNDMEASSSLLLLAKEPVVFMKD